jgi:hypothetical protein
MDSLISIETNPSLVRDLNNNGIINTNTDNYNRYVHTKKQREEEALKIQSIEDDIKCLKDDLCVIKNLLINFNNSNR